MRKLLVGLGIAGLLLVGNSEVNAQKSSSSKELNERIKALRSRLQAYQTKNVRQTPAGLLADDEAGLIVAQPELKGEKIVEELESRKDVAVTVLFHDSDTASVPVQDSQVDVTASSVLASAAVTEKASADPHELRSKRYEDLRQRVYLATRNARSQAGEISRQVASLP